jgi:hypothetical protein
MAMTSWIRPIKALMISINLSPLFTASVLDRHGINISLKITE